MPCFPSRTALGLHKELPSLCNLCLAVIRHCTSDTYTLARMCQGSDDKGQLFLPGVSLYDLTRILQGGAYVEELWIQTAWVQTPTLPLTKLFEPWPNYLASLYLHFLIYRMEIITIPIITGCWEE